MVKNPPADAGDARDTDSIPGSGRSPGGGHGNPLQDSCLEISGTEEPGRLQSTGLQRVNTIEATEMHTHREGYKEDRRQVPGLKTT